MDILYRDACYRAPRQRQSTRRSSAGAKLRLAAASAARQTTATRLRETLPLFVSRVSSRSTVKRQRPVRACDPLFAVVHSPLRSDLVSSPADQSRDTKVTQSEESGPDFSRRDGIFPRRVRTHIRDVFPLSRAHFVLPSPPNFVLFHVFYPETGVPLDPIDPHVRTFFRLRFFRDARKFSATGASNFSPLFAIFHAHSSRFVDARSIYTAYSCLLIVLAIAPNNLSANLETSASRAIGFYVLSRRYRIKKKKGDRRFERNFCHVNQRDLNLNGIVRISFHLSTYVSREFAVLFYYVAASRLCNFLQSCSLYGDF